MTYRIYGGVKITGLILEDEVLETNQYRAGDGGMFVIKQDGIPDDVQLVDGVLTIIEGTLEQTVTFRNEGVFTHPEYDSSDIHRAVKALLKQIKAAGCEVTGALKVDGLPLDSNNPANAWCFRFSGKGKSAKATYESAKIVWSDGAEEVFEDAKVKVSA